MDNTNRRIKYVLVVYDSKYGNTAKVARIIGGAFPRPKLVAVQHVNNVVPTDLEGIDLLVVGSPTQGGRPTPDIESFINHLPVNALRGLKVAAFDTRFAINEHGLGLKLLMKTIGFAAGRIAAGLQEKGGELIAEPKGFIVQNKEGPLGKRELIHIVHWARQIGVPGGLAIV